MHLNHMYDADVLAQFDTIPDGKFPLEPLNPDCSLLESNDEQYVQDMGVMETVGVATAGILAAQSMLATAIAAPVYAGIMTAAAGGLVYSGYRRRNDLPLVPSFGSTEAPTPGEVTNAAGTPVPVASI